MKQPNKLPKEIVNLFTPLIEDEITAFYTYRSASNWCKNVGYNIASLYFSKESDDELMHLKKIENFLISWNVTPPLPSIKQPELEFTSLVQVIELSYKLEYNLYEMYEKTSAEIFETGDLCVFDFLQQFRTIQSNSVAEYSDMINILNGVNTDSKFELLMLEETLFED